MPADGESFSDLSDEGQTPIDEEPSGEDKETPHASDSLLDSLLDTLDEQEAEENIIKSTFDSAFSDEEAEIFTGEIPIDDILSLVNFEESQIDVESLPNFTQKRNVYGTMFNVSGGFICRPQKMEFATKYRNFISFAQKATENECSLKSLVSRTRNKSECLNYGTKLKLSFRYVNVICKTEEEALKMETLDIQKEILKSLNTQVLTVILLGVDEMKRVTGFYLPCKERDNLRMALDTAIQTEFNPPLETIFGLLDINFILVNEAPREDQYLAVIRVKQIRNRKYKLLCEGEER
ncbi:unnamed protein product [Caenorhabditis bovis]|uniref:Uncharacterized protein n=1 Tax=Caenorhabditis bovis TaxID=2654633 RepID=A0A8S1FCN1_9PELO|nr:unnamed protein product [Caenorhabditis bovis]